MCPFAVRVAWAFYRLAAFLGSLFTSLLLRASTPHTFRFASRTGFASLDHRLHPSTGISVARPDFHSSVPASLTLASKGLLTLSSVGLAFRLSLRPRLTLIRLTLIRKPWSSGGRVSRPPYRYLYLHLLFHNLQRGSSPIFCGHGMLPYR